MQIQINHKNRELKEHGTYSFPVLVSYETLSGYDRKSFFWHWHPEIELTLILEGDISYQAGSREYSLKAGEGIFCNSNVPHTGKRLRSADCRYLSVTFHPRIIYGFESSLLHTRYVAPLTVNSQPEALIFQESAPWQKQVLALLKEIQSLSEGKNDMYEFRLQILLSQIWALLYEYAAPGDISFSSGLQELERVRSILSYLHSHYSEKIRLEDIASHVNICPSECCRFFKKQMKESIFSYLLRYRIEKSLSLLECSGESVTDISLKTGFLNPCYFSKVFREEMKCSPSEYRKQKHNSRKPIPSPAPGQSPPQSK